MSSENPQVMILMGSDSDWPMMESCYKTLKDFGINCSVKVSSAHRCPDQTGEIAKTAHENGCKVLIAAAGMAAHLAGVLAAHSPLPVIGVPINSGPLPGFDALLSTVQMPPGIPVATVGIGSAGAKNAALLAVQILSTGDKSLVQKMLDHKKSMVEGVAAKDAKLQSTLA